MVPVVFILTLWVSAIFGGKHVMKAMSNDDDIIRFVNEKSGASWKAGSSKRFENIEDMRKLLGVLPEEPESKAALRPTISHDRNINLPESFDAREKWPMCSSIGEIRDQSSCGSCWAFSTTEAMTDRRCIHSGGKLTERLSVRDLISCCSSCGRGCHGGWIGVAWDFWKRVGIVTGGSMENQIGCQPYPFPTCSHNGHGTRQQCQKDLYDTPSCKNDCRQGYEKTYEQDKTYATSSYNMHRNEHDIMTEIMTNGPVSASFTVFEDFKTYESGIYHHVAGRRVGGHAIKVVGWGVEDGVPYWLIANSWNEEWGEDGYFRIRRGNNECGIESNVVAGMPKI